MKTLPKVAGTLALVLLGALASGSAMAQHYGHGHGHGYGGHAHWGISLGFPIYAPGFYPAPYYAYPAPVYGYPAVVIAPSAPPVYVEQGAVEAAPAPAPAQNDWYYCAESRAYYPYVAQCPSGWQRVPAQAPAR